MRHPVLAWIVPIDGGAVDPGFGRPGGGFEPVDPGYGRPGWRPVDPGYGRPGWRPVDPGFGRPGGPADPGYDRPQSIVIPPDAIAPGVPSQAIVLTPPVDPGYGRPDFSPVDPGFGQGGRDHISPPIVYPPGFPSNGLPPTPGLPPLAPVDPIFGIPETPPPSTKPPIGMWPPMQPARGERLPDGSVLLVPVPTDKPMPMPPDAPTGSTPVIAYYGPGTLPVMVWLPPQAAPK